MDRGIVRAAQWLATHDADETVGARDELGRYSVILGSGIEGVPHIIARELPGRMDCLIFHDPDEAKAAWAEVLRSYADVLDGSATRRLTTDRTRLWRDIGGR